jgi:AbrB family looped-hinge helix DNA binding protein
MSKVTSKLQVTIPKALAVKYGIRPGDEVRWEEIHRGAVMVRASPGPLSPGAPAPGAMGGEGLVAEGVAAPALGRRGFLTARDLTLAERLAVFDAQTRRITHPEEVERAQERERARRRKVEKERGWSREDLYGDRGCPR